MWRNHYEQEHRGYSCEYAKSAKATCKGCSEKIEKGELRLAIYIQSQTFDGNMATWHHFKCFFRKASVRSANKIRGFELLRYADQERIMEKFPSNTIKIEPKKEVENVINPLLLELSYAPNNRFKCTMCKSKIAKNAIIMSERPHVSSKKSAKNHLSCFAKRETEARINCQPEDIEGFNALKEADKDKIKEFVDSIKSSNLKRKSNVQENDSNEGTLSKKPKIAQETLSDKLKAQSDKFWALSDSLKRELKAKHFKELIELNKQKIINIKGYDEILAFLCDMMCYGPLEPCPVCKGQLNSRSNKYQCSGNITNFTRCIHATQEPVRRNEFLIPKELKTKFECLKNFKFQMTKKLFQFPIEKSAQQTIQAKSSQFARSAGQSMERDTSSIVGGGLVYPNSGLENSGHVLVDPETNEHYSCALSGVDILSGYNSFYQLQVIKHNTEAQWYVFRAWGRLGTDFGGYRVPSHTSEAGALKEFNFFFKDKTGIQWKDRKTTEKQPGKMCWLEIEKCYEDKDAKNRIDAAQKMCEKDFVSKSELPSQVQKLVKQIFDVENMKYQMKRFKIDFNKMPLGKVSSNQIKKAYSILTDLTSLLEHKGDPNLILDSSNRFYSLIPHYFGGSSPTLLDDPKLIKEKLNMLDSLTEIEIAYNLIKNKNENNELGEQDPIDYHFNQLNCDMQVLDKESEEFQQLSAYISNTHSKEHAEYKLEVEDIFKIKRNGEHEKYEKYKHADNRKLLFHGSRITNYASILSKGLKIAPKEAPSSGYMFGKGVYFADMVSKSANYCYATKENSQGLLLICEVALGNMLELKAAKSDLKKLPDGKHSTFGRGRLMPDPTKSLKTSDGVEIPLGTPIELDAIKTALIHNEFIVYDTDQIKMKYLFKVNFKFGK